MMAKDRFVKLRKILIELNSQTLLLIGQFRVILNAKINTEFPVNRKITTKLLFMFLKVYGIQLQLQ